MPISAWLDSTLLTAPIYGNSTLRWIQALGVTALAWLILRWLRGKLVARLTRDGGELGLRELSRAILDGTISLFLLVCGLYLASQLLALPLKLRMIVRGMFTVVAALQVGLWGTRFVTFALARQMQQRGPDNKAIRSAYALIALFGQFVVWSLVLLLGLQNIGVDVTALVAGLGIGGIALALGVQRILGDLIGSLSIVLDKPFEVGDSIAIADLSGTVERIGLRTTRLRAASGEELIFSNYDLLASRIRNHRSQRQKRNVMLFTIAYDTPPARMREIPDLVRSVVETQPSTRLDCAYFKSYTDIGAQFETIYFITQMDALLHVKVQQEINMRVFELLAEKGIQLAHWSADPHKRAYGGAGRAG